MFALRFETIDYLLDVTKWGIFFNLFFKL